MPDFLEKINPYTTHHTRYAHGGFAVTPDDDTDLSNLTRGIYIGGAGDVSVMFHNGDIVVFSALAVGVIHPIGARRVRSTGTTATNIIGVF